MKKKIRNLRRNYGGNQDLDTSQLSKESLEVAKSVIDDQN